MADLSACADRVLARSASAPVGWSADKVANSDGPEPAVVDGVVQSVIHLLAAAGGG